MLRRPWQIWLLFTLCLAVVLPALAWLTHQTLAADQAEWRGRIAAQREETIGNVLWQMDTELTALLAQEAARPHFVYSSFYAAPAVVTNRPASAETSADPSPPTPTSPTSWQARQLPSPLLMQPSPYVLLHFQVKADGELTSPQVPQGRLASLAIDNGAARDNIEHSAERLAELYPVLSYNELLAALPSERLPEIGVGQWQFNNNSILVVAQNDPQVVGNSLDVEQVKKQLDQEQLAAQNPNAQQQQGIYAQSPGSPYASYNLNNRSQSRAGNDLQQRNQAYQTAAQRQVVEQRLNYQAAPQLKYVSEGVSQPIWIEGRLLLARRVKAGNDELIQGCWLDWQTIRAELAAKYEDVLPGLRLEPVTRTTDRGQIRVSRMLATLPVQLVWTDPPFDAQPWSPLRGALVLAWSMLVLAAGAVALLLQGVITLSERRGAFVSAVTHELRTPLTTFRMYAEMLAENMVPSAETRQRYLDTLRVEADRLSHLVENVLAYARLERGRHGRRREPTSLVKVIDDWQSRFAERAAQAELQLVCHIDPSAANLVVSTDPSAVEQILFNLIDNACKYAVTAEDRRLHLELSASKSKAIIRVRDHGPGIDARAARNLFQPFSKSVHDAACSAPGVGLGLALSRRLAEQLGGKLELESTAETGATFNLSLPR